VELQHSYADIRAEGAEVVALSTDPMEDAQRMVDYSGAQFPVLSDSNQAVSRSYGLFDLLGDNLAAPATIVLDRSGAIVGSVVGQSVDDRVPAAAIVEFLREL
jgi:thioredoxin-dependent peroxiredoxin